LILSKIIENSFKSGSKYFYENTLTVQEVFWKLLEIVMSSWRASRQANQLIFSIEGFSFAI